MSIMSYEEYLEFDKLMWKGSASKRAKALMAKWQKLTQKEKDSLMERKWKEEL